MSCYIEVFDKIINILKTELDSNGYNKKYNKFILKTQKHFLNWILNNGITDLNFVTKMNIYDYQNELLSEISLVTGKKLSKNTLCSKYNAVKMIFSSLFRAGLLNKNITSGINFELPKTQGLKRQAFSNEQMSQILEKIDINTKIGLRNRTIFELIYSSGLRVSEVSKLLIKDICFEKREMLIRGKFSKDRIVPISKMAIKYLVLYLENRVYNIDEPLFRSMRRQGALKPESISNIFTDLLIKYGMKKKELSTHSIRHASASQLLNNGAGIRHIQELLGHKNPETTVLYTHTQGDILAKIFRKYHPQEHDLFDAVDDEYRKKLEITLGIQGIT